MKISLAIIAPSNAPQCGAIAWSLVSSKDMIAIYNSISGMNNKMVREIYANEKLLPSIIEELFPEIESLKYTPWENKLCLFWHCKSCQLSWASKIYFRNLLYFKEVILTDGNQSSIISPYLNVYTLTLVTNIQYKSICFPFKSHRDVKLQDGKLLADHLSNNTSKAGII